MKNGMIILNYNDSENTSLLLEDIKDYKILDPIIVVDNKSTDDSVKKLKKYENKKIRIIEAEENKGYASGNNVGIKYLLENYDVENIIISNPDIIVREEEIKKLVRVLEKKDVAVVAPNVKEPLGISRGWRLPTFVSELVSNIPFFRRFEMSLLHYPEKEYEKKLTKVDVVKGCFFIIKKEALEDIDYFDENTFLYYEEIIMAKRLKEKGYTTCVDNEVTVIHALSQSVDKSVKRIEKFKILKESQYYYEKYVNQMNICKLFILRIFYYVYLFCLQIENKIKARLK